MALECGSSAQLKTPLARLPDGKEDRGDSALFLCEENSFVTQIEGSAGDDLDSIRFPCSDGKRSELMGGSGGSDFILPFSEKGHKGIFVNVNEGGRSRGEYVIRGLSLGGETGGKIRGWTNLVTGQGCPMVGAEVMYGRVLNALRFHFKCVNVGP